MAVRTEDKEMYDVHYKELNDGVLMNEENLDEKCYDGKRDDE